MSLSHPTAADFGESNHLRDRQDSLLDIGTDLRPYSDRSHYPTPGWLKLFEQEPRDRSTTFRRDIEGLRGIAVLLVVLFHCELSGLSGGFIGVDVFFVLSGFLITGLLVGEVRKTEKLDLVQFYARRVRRLLPAFALTVLATLLAGAFFMAPHELDWAAHAGRAAALYISNIFFDRNAGDYFGPNVQSNPLLHTWSLAVEEQFYMLWPLLILVTLKWAKSTKALVAVLAGVTVISLGIGVAFTANGATFAFYELPARAWEFGIGGLAVLLPRGGVKLPIRWWIAVGWGGLLAILWAAHFLTITGDTGFPGWIALIPTLGTAVVLIAGTEHPHRGVGVALAAPPLLMLGTLSYSWYLWHWPFLVFSEVMLPTIATAGKIAAAGMALAAAGVSYHLIERPIRFHPFLLTRPVLSVSLAGVVMVVSLGAALLSVDFAERLQNEPKFKTITMAAKDIGKIPRGGQCTPNGIQSAEVKICHFGDPTSATHIVLFGDSHAVHWFNALEGIAEANGWQLTTLLKPSCHSFDITQIHLPIAYRSACARWREEAIAHIIALRPSLVFLGNGTTYLGQKQNFPTPSLDDLREATRRTLESLNGLRVVIMRDNPTFPYDIPTCLARSARHSWYPGGSCEASRAIVLNPAVFEAEQAGAQNLPNVHFIDFSNHFCSRDVCGPVQGDTVMYRDHFHLAVGFVDSLTAPLEVEMLRVLNAS